MQTIFWHDYETFGADTKRDRPCQFAGVRTDLDLNIIEEPYSFYCRPSDDVLPAPEACLITGITPQIAMENGFTEAEFANKIQAIFSVPDTCVAGYNSIRFDDEISRNLFYRSFIDPYEREWKDGNSRWDVIDVVRLAYALRPDGINWPRDEQGIPSFRLEKLSAANGIEHLSAHDAMSDVYATIGIAKLIKETHPQLFEYVFQNRSKNRIKDLLDCRNLKPLVHISSKYPASSGCCALVVPLFQEQQNKNAYVSFDLRQDPRYIMSLDSEEIRHRLFTPKTQLAEGTVRPGIKSIHINKCPMLVPASMMKTMDSENLERWDLNIDKMRSNLEWIRSEPRFIEKVKAAMTYESSGGELSDADLMIYSGGFFSAADKSEMTRVRAATELELAEYDFSFEDDRLAEMLFRYKARNFSSTLTEDEQSKWQQHCAYNLMDGKSGYLTFNDFFSRLNQLSQTVKSPQELAILEDLKYYAESIIPYA